ncbi:MAG: universal stress protein, partial [Bacteroidia bacterium]
MKTLLVPTDFSDNAKNAMYFAFMLAKKEQAKIILLHAFHLPVPVADIPYHILAEEKKNKKTEIEGLLRKECSGLLHTSPEVEYLAVEGLGMDVIVETAEKRNVDYIVMGTKGRSNLAGILFGSITSRVMEWSKVPVIAIPQKVEFFQPVKTITYATDYHRSDIASIRKITELAAALDATVHLLHITGDETGSEDGVALMQKFMRKVKEHVEY